MYMWRVQYKLLETKAHRYVYVEVTIETLLETKAHRYILRLALYKENNFYNIEFQVV